MFPLGGMALQELTLLSSFWVSSSWGFLSLSEPCPHLPGLWPLIIVPLALKVYSPESTVCGPGGGRWEGVLAIFISEAGRCLKEGSLWEHRAQKGHLLDSPDSLKACVSLLPSHTEKKCPHKKDH